MKENSKKKERKLVLIIVLALLIIIVMLCTRFFLEDKSYDLDIKAKIGQLEDKSEEEIQRELDRVVQEGMFHIVINVNPVFKNGKAEGNLKIENVPANTYLMKVKIIRDDTKEDIYETKYLKPNSYIQKDKLDRILPKGDYDCTATFYAYDLKTIKEAGSTSCKIKVRVQN